MRKYTFFCGHRLVETYPEEMGFNLFWHTVPLRYELPFLARKMRFFSLEVIPLGLPEMSLPSVLQTVVRARLGVVSTVRPRQKNDLLELIASPHLFSFGCTTGLLDQCVLNIYFIIR